MDRVDHFVGVPQRVELEDGPDHVMMPPAEDSDSRIAAQIHADGLTEA
jgi:hypothetical protein